MQYRYEWSHAPIEGEVGRASQVVGFATEAEAVDWAWREAEAVVAMAMVDRTTGTEGTISIEIPRTFMRMTRCD